MASTVGAIKNVLSDRFWIPKLGVFTAAYFYLRNQSHIWHPTLNDQTVLLFECMLFALLIGFATVSMNRNINNVEPFIPGFFSIVDVLIKGFCAIILMIPGMFLAYAAYILINNTCHFEEIFVTALIYLLAAAIVSAFIMVPVVLYSAKGNLLDGLRFDLIIKGAGNYIVQILGFVLIYALVMGFVTIVLYKLLEEMLGDHPALLVLQCSVIIFTFYTLFSYSSDMYGNGIPEVPEKKVKKIIKRPPQPQRRNLKR